MKQALFIVAVAAISISSIKSFAGNSTIDYASSNYSASSTNSKNISQTTKDRIRETRKDSDIKRTPSRLAVDCELISGRLWLCPNFDYSLNNVTVINDETGEIFSAILTPQSESFYIGYCEGSLTIICEVDDREFEGQIYL